MTTNIKFLNPIAIKIAAPRTAHILETLEPAFGDLDYKTDLKDNYVVFDYPDNGDYTIMTPSVFKKTFKKRKETWFMKPILVTLR